MHDLVIAGGIVFDGFGGDGVEADVAVSAGRIVAIGSGLGAARERISVAGLAVAPGFIDPHSHSDSVPFLDAPQPFKLLQGVTTEIVGNCGYTCAPTSTGSEHEIMREAGIAFTRFRDYLDAVDAAGTTNHLAALVGHNTLRLAVAGFERELPPDGLERMRELAEEAFAAGAVGLSSGLEYSPGAYAGIEELVALGHVARRWGGTYATHMRSEGEGVLAALDEAIEVARRTGVTLQISHLKASGHRTHGSADAMLARIAAARRAGLDVQGDLYPFSACGTGLIALLPTEVSEGGGTELQSRLASPEERRRLRAVAEHPVDYLSAGLWREVRPDGVTITVHRDTEHIGRTIAEIAGPADPWDTVCALVAADPHAGAVLHTMDERDIEAFMRDPLVSIGSDNDAPVGLVHPRTYGTFPRFLGEYVRDRGVLPLGEAVRRATSVTAKQFGLSARGWLGVGAAADITVFDHRTIGYAGDYVRPDAHPTGVRWVTLDGIPVIRDGEFTGERRGSMLRAGRA
ncbi:N-acyl-D-amino-acid deacylase family protein [Leucobacter iarius]|uniref:Amidohydrolase family protein n=1 Tax=Leucobacter iarius TaxID=333963 RepID=A0ABP4XWM6_9MICO